MSSTLELTRPTTTATVNEHRGGPTSRRDPWFDNAKMLLVTLVVVGHTWTVLPASRPHSWLYDFLYLWHVPAFVMVTGYLSRSFTWSRAGLTKLMTGVALPYVVFEAAMALFRTRVGGEHLEDVFADPHWPMWYLAVLFLWRLATPLLKSPKALGVAVAISLVGGLTSGEWLDTARAMGLLPFFVLGLLARREHIEMLRGPAVRVGAAVTLATAFALAWFMEGRMQTEWLYWRSSYDELGVSFTDGVLVRAGLLVVATAVALSFLALVPRRAGWFSRLGAATLVVYLFHGFFVKSAQYAGAGDWAVNHPWPGLLVTTALAVVLALCLASPPVARRLSVVVDPVAAYRRHRAHT
jgi:fucose 4-O-acetylase-like acetyltransferase